MKKSIAAILCVVLLCSGCASTSGALVAAGPTTATPAVDPVLMGSYVTRLPIGSRVRVSLADGHRLKGTLMKADSGEIVIQPRTRIPEPPMTIALDRIATVELDKNGSAGRTVGIGIASGAAGVFGAFLILAMIFAGD